jgi:hypothetical protein
MCPPPPRSPATTTATPTNPTTRPATASELFYTRGIHAVGVDLIAELAGTTKKTLYDRFGSKDNLVALYLQRRFERWQAFVEERLAACPPRPRPGTQRVRRTGRVAGGQHLRVRVRQRQRRDRRRRPPGVTVIRPEKQWMRDRYEQLARDAGLPTTLESGSTGTGRHSRTNGRPQAEGIPGSARRSGSRSIACVHHTRCQRRLAGATYGPGARSVPACARSRRARTRRTSPRHSHPAGRR